MRGTQRYVPMHRTDEDALTGDIIALASEYCRYGYRRITALLQARGWPVGKDRVQRIWWREGLKVPEKQHPRARLWLNDGSCVRLRPERANHFWGYDFMSGITHDGRTLRMLALIDEYARECLAIRVARRLGRYDMIEALADVMLFRGIPETMRSDRADVREPGTAESTTSCVTKQYASCLLPLFLPATSITFAETPEAKRNQVVHHIATEPAPAFHVVDLQTLHGTALLTPPTISVEGAFPDDCVFFRAQLESRSFLA